MVLAHLIEENLRYGLEKAVIKSLKKARGTYGLAIMVIYCPDKIIAVHNTSPLVIDISDGGNIIASIRRLLLIKSEM